MVTHSVDDRRPTLVTRLYVASMWAARDKRAFEGAARTLRTARARQRAGDRPPTPWTRLLTRISSDRRHGMTTWTVWPRRARPVVRVLYLHGGGYAHPLTVDYWRLVRALVRTPAEVVVPAYPLAPDAEVDDVLPLLEDLAAELVTGELPVVLMGDSAGGALVLEVARALADRGTPPAHVVGLSPWLDATLDEREVADLEATDPMLAESGLRAAGRWWAAAVRAGTPPRQPGRARPGRPSADHRARGRPRHPPAGRRPSPRPCAGRAPARGDGHVPRVDDEAVAGGATDAAADGPPAAACRNWSCVTVERRALDVPGHQVGCGVRVELGCTARRTRRVGLSGEMQASSERRRTTQLDARFRSSTDHHREVAIARLFD